MRGKHFSVTRSVSHSLILMLRLSVSDTSTIITGLYAQAAQIPGKWLQILEELSRAFGSWQRCWTRMLRLRAWHSKRSCSNFPSGSRLMRANAPTFASAKLKIQKELNNAAGREAPASVSEGRALSEVHLTTSAPLVPRRHPRRMRWITCSSNAVYTGFTTPRCGERGANFGRAALPARP
jgi:hypothetical protein